MKLSEPTRGIKWTRVWNIPFQRSNYRGWTGAGNDTKVGYVALIGELVMSEARKKPRIIPAMPTHDLVKLWEEHVAGEFVTRDTEATLATMTEDAYVNHIPVLTGGYGKAALRDFYSRSFIPVMPPDTTLTPVSRTVGEDQVVDEMVFSFTHTQEMPWMLPGVAPTHRRVELTHEHIYWDQASVLKQLELLNDPSLPVAGVESARKVLDPQFKSKA
jgi:carboxymethylenebutenolidase